MGFVTLFFIGQTSFSQSTITEEPSVTRLMSKFLTLALAEPNIEGWRIKIVNTTDRREMERASYKFKQMYPEIVSKSAYENPYYSIRVGAYESRIDLEKFLVELKPHFHNVIPVREKILKEEIVLFLGNGR